MQIRRFFCGEKDEIESDFLTKSAGECPYNKAYRNSYMRRFVENG